MAFIKVEFTDAIWSGELMVMLHDQPITVIKPDWFGTRNG